MAEVTVDMPLIAIHPEKMFNSWKSTIKICALIAFFCVVCGYMHICIRTYMIKRDRLEQILVMLMASDKMMQKLFALDQNLVADLEELNDFYLDY